jgi:hypothetical protein
MASDLNIYSNTVDDYAEIFHALTPTLFECNSQFIERSPRATKEAYVGLGKSLGGNVESALGAINAIGAAHSIVASFKGISADLNMAVTRLESVDARLIGEITNYRTSCEQLQSLAIGKSIP